MSKKTQQRANADRRLCQLCRQRPARFRYKGRVKRDRDHDICFQCYRRLISQDANKVAGRVTELPMHY